MTQEAFLAASSLDKLTEMESVIASPPGTSESTQAPGSNGYLHTVVPQYHRPDTFNT